MREAESFTALSISTLRQALQTEFYKPMAIQSVSNTHNFRDILGYGKYLI